MFYFKRRNYKVICNRKEWLPNLNASSNKSIFWGINKPWSNPDSQIVAAMSPIGISEMYNFFESRMKRTVLLGYDDDVAAVGEKLDGEIG